MISGRSWGDNRPSWHFSLLFCGKIRPFSETAGNGAPAGRPIFGSLMLSGSRVMIPYESGFVRKIFRVCRVNF